MQITITNHDGIVYAWHEVCDDECTALADAIAVARFSANTTGKVDAVLADIEDAAEAEGEGRPWWE